MSVEVTISSKGQIVIPKDVRDALGLQAGEKLRLSHQGDRLTMERVGEPARERISYEEFRRRVPAYEGPPITLEEMDARIGDLFEDWRSRT